ncbi:MAG: universal stress protein [Flavobacteriaceae bacterium]|nr:universal stress protein [Flavobacteriaceae bacterium]|tara:strand:- start:278 stop:712 length:435 start_codon:yes stop_codon:yes gene_type:complete
MKNILVAIDLDGNEQKLLDKAYEFGKAFNAKVWLIHIAAPNPDFVGFEAGPQYIRDERATELREEHQQLQVYADALYNKGIEADGLLVQGATLDMILEESKKLNIDLIIIGHTEHNFIYKAIYGSVSLETVKQADIPVLTVPID